MPWEDKGSRRLMVCPILTLMELQEEAFILRHGRINAAFSSTIGARMHGHCTGETMDVADTMSTHTLSPGADEESAYTAPRQNNHLLHRHDD